MTRMNRDQPRRGTHTKTQAYRKMRRIVHKHVAPYLNVDRELTKKYSKEISDSITEELVWFAMGAIKRQRETIPTEQDLKIFASNSIYSIFIRGHVPALFVQARMRGPNLVWFGILPTIQARFIKLINALCDELYPLMIPRVINDEEEGSG